MSSADLSDSDSKYIESEEDAENERRNRWKGAPSTWQTLTAQERGLATSLDQIRNADLSVHLYNAHALKKRAQILSENPDDTRLRNEYPVVPLEDQIFKPPKVWTAWPLPPDEVPREDYAAPNDGDEKYMSRLKDREWPSRQLEDVLVGVTLKFAKERFEERESASESNDSTERKKAKTGTSKMHSDEEDEDELLYVDGMEPVIKVISETPPPKKLLRPVVSADDDRSRAILRPCVRDTLSKLDSVLMALHHTRKSCRRFSHFEPDTDDENIVRTGAGNSGSPSKKTKGRPRKFANLTDRSLVPPSIEHDSNDPALFRTKKKHRGRPQKVYPRLEGETQQEYLTRISRIQKKPLPSFAPPAPIKEPSLERARRSPSRRATSEELRTRKQRTLGQRDWSEVLGSAALVGFPEDVISKATQRCANLFGEGMAFQIIPEVPFTEQTGVMQKRYQPDTIPELEEEHSFESCDDESPGSKASDSGSDNNLKKASNKKQKLVSYAIQTCFCPVSECSRKRRRFPSTSALKRHLQQGHEIPVDQLDEYILPSDEEMDGAAHVDGFLRPFKKLRGSKGKYKKRSRGEETKSEEQSDDSGVMLQNGDETLLSVDEQESELEQHRDAADGVGNLSSDS